MFFVVMGHISTIRAEKVSTNLSLIATVFLPITFLASAFGMNFEKNGDYTMEILNSPQVVSSCSFRLLKNDQYDSNCLFC